MSASRPSVDEESQQTLLAIKEFARYLENMEKDLSNLSKRFRNKEIAQSVGFVGTGIHEALQYLGIVKKVIQKTQRILDKKTVVPSIETAPTTPKDEKRSPSIQPLAEPRKARRSSRLSV